VKVTAKNIAAGRQQLRSDGPLCDGIVQQGISFIDLRLLQNSFCNKPTGGTPHPAHAKPNGRTAPTFVTAKPNGRAAPTLHTAEPNGRTAPTLHTAEPNGRTASTFVIPSGAEGSAVRPSVLPNLRIKPQHPNRIVIPSGAEGSAVRPSVLPNSPDQTPTPKQNCHPKHPSPRLIEFSPCLSMIPARFHPKSLNGREPRSPSP
jgi:hypothetical protein